MCTYNVTEFYCRGCRRVIPNSGEKRLLGKCSRGRGKSRRCRVLDARNIVKNYKYVCGPRYDKEGRHVSGCLGINWEGVVRAPKDGGLGGAEKTGEQSDDESDDKIGEQGGEQSAGQSGEQSSEQGSEKSGEQSDESDESDEQSGKQSDGQSGEQVGEGSRC